MNLDEIRPSRRGITIHAYLSGAQIAPIGMSSWEIAQLIDESRRRRGWSVAQFVCDALLHAVERERRLVR